MSLIMGIAPDLNIVKLVDYTLTGDSNTIEILGLDISKYNYLKILCSGAGKETSALANRDIGIQFGRTDTGYAGAYQSQQNQDIDNNSSRDVLWITFGDNINGVQRGFGFDMIIHNWLNLIENDLLASRKYFCSWTGGFIIANGCINGNALITKQNFTNIKLGLGLAGSNAFTEDGTVYFRTGTRIIIYGFK